jgi:hypothetical protein
MSIIDMVCGKQPQSLLCGAVREKTDFNVDEALCRDLNVDAGECFVAAAAAAVVVVVALMVVVVVVVATAAAVVIMLVREQALALTPLLHIHVLEYV